jgi:hypothetical protein
VSVCLSVLRMYADATEGVCCWAGQSLEVEGKELSLDEATASWNGGNCGASRADRSDRE